jgi:hypothetical protein
VSDRAITKVTALAWPGEPVALAFLDALGFRAETGPGSRNLYGTPSYPDYDGPGEDRVVLARRVADG